MKKILCLFLALACMLSVVACNGGDNDSGNNSADGSGGNSNNSGGGGDVSAKTVEEIVESSVPTKVVTKVNYKLPVGHELAEYDLDGIYSLVVDGGNSILTYSYGVLADIEDDADAPVKTVAGVLYSKNGKVSSDGVNWTPAGTASVTPEFNLIRSYFDTYVRSDDGLSVTATVSGADIDKIIGHTVDAVGDITVTVITNGVYLTDIVMTYKSTLGASVVVETTYSYNKVELEFPS